MHALSDDAPRVLAIHPATGAWPANLLRFHVVFDRAMDRDRALDHVWLEDEACSRVGGALVDMPDGLWSADQTVLTVLLHPGRVKQGLAARAALGPVLQEGGIVTVVVSGAMQSADGVALGYGRRHRARIGPAVPSALEPAAWRMPRPLPGTRDALTIDTGTPLDVLSAARAITLADAAGRPVPAFMATEGERLRVTPFGVWPAGPLTLHVAVDLEDAAGNRPGLPFEHAIGDGKDLPWAN